MESEKLTNPATRRRSDRILGSVHIRVIGNNASGVSFAEETETISFNQQGARISLTSDLLPDDVVLIKNVGNEIEEELIGEESSQERIRKGALFVRPDVELFFDYRPGEICAILKAQSFLWPRRGLSSESRWVPFRIQTARIWFC